MALPHHRSSMPLQQNNRVRQFHATDSFMMEGSRSGQDAHLAYLEPPHLHDPALISELISLPSSTLAKIPGSVKTALYNLEQSTSILYASYVRFQNLLRQRFDRLLSPSKMEHKIEFSELSFFNYANSLDAERTYLLSGAHPDWRHKAAFAQVALRPYAEIPFEPHSLHTNSASTISQWQARLHSKVACWYEYVKTIHVPDYVDTVSEYLANQNQTPSLITDLDDTPLGSPFEAPTPTSIHKSASLQFVDITPHNFDASLLPEEEPVHSLDISTVAELMLLPDGERETLLKNTSQGYTERQDDELVTSD